MISGNIAGNEGKLSILCSLGCQKLSILCSLGYLKFSILCSLKVKNIIIMPFLMLKTTAEDSLFWKKSFIFAKQ